MKKQICVTEYPPFSPDLLPCDYFRFLKLKTTMKRAVYNNILGFQETVTEIKAHAF